MCFSKSLVSATILTFIIHSKHFHCPKHRYEIGRDPAAWFQINPQTAVITFKRTIDRESIYVVNGVYTAEVLAITRGKNMDFVLIVIIAYKQ